MVFRHRRIYSATKHIHTSLDEFLKTYIHQHTYKNCEFQRHKPGKCISKKVTEISTVSQITRKHNEKIPKVRDSTGIDYPAGSCR